ncbi:MAG: flagellar basal body P-ring protein FlgI [Alphaproteobacteria bacterium]|nr:flagellar basal body P-ring protein FlgI [Alphaproteobacteria bacterium]MDD9919424.1 flagellar basal body P-ring protein FlgI [Alphaproteobacteria bacterium]
MRSIQFFTALLGMLALVMATFNTAQAAPPIARVKDIADFEGVRDNVLIGYGLIVGLNGTGDSVNSIPFTRQTLVNMLERLGVNSRDVADQLKTKNIAAVMVTSKMPSLARQGSKIDITVSSLGDSKSLEGGLLLATPLVGADGNTYAVAQGAVVVGGFSAEGKSGTKFEKNHTTVGRIASGAVVERETGFELSQLGDSLRLMLREPDFTTAIRLQKEIDEAFGADIAKATDRGTIDIKIPAELTDNIAMAMHKIENLHVRPGSSARIIIDEKTGTIVMGEDVRISNVAISHSNITIQVSEAAISSQPSFTFNEGGETIKLDRSLIKVEEEQDADKGRFRMLNAGASLADLVKGLNALGVQPRDVISILQNIKAAGAIQAELVVM